MTTGQNLTYEMLKDVRVFARNHGAAFAPGSNAAQRIAANDAFIDQIEDVAGIQRSGGQNYSGGTVGKDADVRALRARLKALIKTGQTVFDNDPDQEAKMRMPRQGKITELVTAAKALRDIAAANQAAFLAEEMPADFIAQLNAAIAQLGATGDEQRGGLQQRAGATAALTPLLREAVKNVRLLDTPVTNKFAADAGILREWEAASSIEDEDSVDKGTPNPVVSPTP